MGGAVRAIGTNLAGLLLGRLAGDRRLGVALAALVVANLLPVLGVLLLGWAAGDVLVVYWLENVAVGVWTAARLATGRASLGQDVQLRLNGRPVQGTGRACLVPFFLAHYGLFTLVHGVFTAMLAAWAGVGGTWAGWAVTFVLLMVSHGVDFWTRWLRDGERDRVGTGAVMGQAYLRIFLLHVTLIAGVGLLVALGGRGRVLPLVLLVVLKTAVDVVVQVRRARRNAARTQVFPESTTVPTAGTTPTT